MIHSLKGFENAEIMRIGYAIEYDCIDPTQLRHTLEFKNIPGLYGAGQFNGTSGYEEAAAQGLIAGINAAQKILGKDPLELDRSTSYIGTLIDDLVIKGTPEPYRMMTSRSEYRLLLRQDNADTRLTPIGHELRLISEDRYEKFLLKQERIKKEVKRLNSTHVSPGEELEAVLAKCGTTSADKGAKLAELLRRPEISYDDLTPIDKNRPELPYSVTEEAEILVKYEGYIQKQLQQVEQFKKLEVKRLPQDFDYNEIKGLRLEAIQKLNKQKPENIGQAGRISGVSPADVAVLLVYFKYI